MLVFVQAVVFKTQLACLDLRLNTNWDQVLNVYNLPALMTRARYKLSFAPACQSFTLLQAVCAEHGTHKVHISILLLDSRQAVNMSYVVFASELCSPWPERSRMAELEGACLEKLFCKIARYFGNPRCKYQHFL